MTMIDRDELLKKIAPMGLSNGSVLGHHSGTADVIAEMIQNAPTIDPETLRPESEWELNPGRITCEHFRCKKCYFINCVATKYCGECGAKMKKLWHKAGRTASPVDASARAAKGGMIKNAPDPLRRPPHKEKLRPHPARARRTAIRGPKRGV